tara:strand:- start:8272 stop:8604 length:333 start_codon:yes stop_codon:yes gene_type:complete
MYTLALCLAAQITCLISLIHSRHEFWYLFWYIPNWLCAAFLVIPSGRLAPGGKWNSKPYFLAYVLFVVLCFLNLGITASPLYLENWAGVAPPVVSLFCSLLVENAGRKRA